MRTDPEPTSPPLAAGPWHLTQVREARGPFLAAATVFAHVEAARLARELDHHGELYVTSDRTRLIVTSQGYLIQGTVAGRRRTLVVDTCAGGPKPKRNPPVPGFVSPWLDRLALAGVRPEEVDTVVMTHLHHDHAGWNTTLEPDGALRPTSGNARHLVARAEYDSAVPQGRRRVGPAPHIRDSVLPLEAAGLLDLVEDGTQVAEGIQILPAPGHTPGHSIVEITGGDRPVLVIGDLVHHPLQVNDPGVSVAMCSDPELSARSRRRVLAHAADTGAVLLAAHLPLPFRVRSRTGHTGFDYLPMGGMPRTVSR